MPDVSALAANRQFLRSCLWMGPAMAFIFGIGFFPIAGFIPPPSPAGSAAEIAQWYGDNLTGIKLGTVVMMFGVVLIAPWGVALAVHTARTEKGLPVLACLQIMCVGVVTFTIVLFTLLW